MTDLAISGFTQPERARERVVRGNDYLFEGREGQVTLRQLSARCRRLAIYHTMPDLSRPADIAETADIAAALHDEGTRLVMVSRAPYAKLEQYRRHFGWDLPAYSAAGNAFTTDFPATRHVAGTTGGELWDDDAPGLSFFRRARGSVLHLGSIAVPRLDFLGILGIPDRAISR
jgi:predicted dithiol-disulfide oxidoreductase (DUF899 family)